MARQHEQPVLPLTTADTTLPSSPPPPPMSTANAPSSPATSISSSSSSSSSAPEQEGAAAGHHHDNHQATNKATHNNTTTTTLEKTFSSTLFLPIDKTYYADLPVCICSFVSGLCDSVVFSASAVFVSMQTGNTIFLALGVANLPTHVPFMWLRALVSISSFLLGAFTFGQLRRFSFGSPHHHDNGGSGGVGGGGGPTTKIVLAANFLVQAILILVAASLAQSHVVPSLADLQVAESMSLAGEIDLIVLLPISLLAFQFGGQIVTSRQLGFNEVPTNVLTSVYCDLMSDPLLFAGPWGVNPKRNRRAAAVVLMFAGAVVGGWLGRRGGEDGMAVALWLGAGIKFVIAVGWLFWRTDEGVPIVKDGGGVVGVEGKK